MAQYFRARKHVGLKRSVNFYEYIRAFAALRKRSQTAKSTLDKSKTFNDEFEYNDDVRLLF